MHYIESELARQERLWTLLTSAPRASGQTEEESGERAGTVGSADLPGEPSGSRITEPGSNPLPAPTPSDGAVLAALLAARSAENRDALQLPQTAARRVSDEPAAVRGREPETVEIRRSVSQDVGTAAALSRSFQRDARRYDGGYPLY